MTSPPSPTIFAVAIEKKTKTAAKVEHLRPRFDVVPKHLPRLVDHSIRTIRFSMVLLSVLSR